MASCAAPVSSPFPVSRTTDHKLAPRPKTFASPGKNLHALGVEVSFVPGVEVSFPGHASATRDEMPPIQFANVDTDSEVPLVIWNAFHWSTSWVSFSLSRPTVALSLGVTLILTGQWRGLREARSMTLSGRRMAWT